jgi:hypothetical protein
MEVAFREAVQLWADERFEALWERGLRASRARISREVFVRGMRHRVVKPTCCWDQIHAVWVHPQATDEAFVEAQVGIAVKTLGTTIVRSMLVSLRRDEGVWRVTLEDFLTRPEAGLSGLRAVVMGRESGPVITLPAWSSWRDGWVRSNDVQSMILVWIAAGVRVSVDNPDTLHVRDATQNSQAHAEHRQPYVGRGVRR